MPPGLPKRRQASLFPDSVGGCNLPRVRIAKVHQAFWKKLGQIIRSPELVKQIFQAAKRIATEPDDHSANVPDPQQQIDKLAGDIDLWYERHDVATNRIEKDAAWQRILELKERLGELQRKAAEVPASSPKPDLAGITKSQIQRYLDDLVNTIANSKDSGVALVQTFVEYHGLRVLLVGADKLVIRMALVPPGVDPGVCAEHAVSIEAEAELPPSEVDAWLRQHQGTVRCKICGKPIAVKRHHYWNGLPEHHLKCWHAEMVRRAPIRRRSL